MTLADTLSRLADTIHARSAASGEASYTKALLEAGVERCAKKLGEEAVELVIAGVAGDPLQVTAEAADVLYHLLVLLEARQVPLAEVYKLLEARTQMSGLAEKAARTAS